MAFNAETYRRNKYRREAWAHLKAARELKAQIAAGERSAELWGWRIASHVKHARIGMNLYRSQRRICNVGKVRIQAKEDPPCST
jgi:hypothetical protein